MSDNIVKFPEGACTEDADFMTAWLAALDARRAAGKPHPLDVRMIAYAVGLSKRLERYVGMLAQYGVITIEDLEKYKKDKFFAEFPCPTPSQQALFVKRIENAGGRFKDCPTREPK